MFTKIKGFVLTLLFFLGSFVPTYAAIITADIELEFFDSGTGPMNGPYGGDTLGSGFPIALSNTSNALDGNLNTFLSLPTDAFITVGFSQGFIFDGAGNDIFVTETGGVNELANVYVSSDNVNFTFLGIAGDGGTTEFDLASIGYADIVTAIRIEGVDLGGGSPGFDLSIVQGLEDSVVLTAIPEPSSIVLFTLASVFLVRRKLG